MDLGVSGLASGFDWRTLVDQLADVERLPERALRADQNRLQQRLLAYQGIQTQLGVLQNKITTLNDPNLFGSRTATALDSTIASASAAPQTAVGNYSIAISQLATSALQQGATNIASPLNSTNNVSSLVLSNASFATPITAGTFTVNGASVAINTTDTLQAVFDRINSATGGAVTASYDSTADKITLSSGSAIVLGSATDTSNFLQAAKLSNNGTGTIVSSGKLGAIQTTGTLASANFATAVSDGGSGNGQFKINGVAISFSATADSVQNVLDRINSAGAGVTASFDSANGRFLLTNNSTGDLGISLQNVTGNFLAATGLSSGTLVRGNNLLYSINSSPTLSSQTNLIASQSSGINGLSITALKVGTTTVQVAADTTKIKSAITDFISAYNAAQTLIDNDTASSTDASGKVTAGILVGESDANDLSNRLRSLATNTLSGLSGTIKRIQDIGIDSNGNDNTLAVTDSLKLDAALANNLSGLKDFFTNASSGFAVQFNTYLNQKIGSSGSVITKENNLTKQSTDIDSQIVTMERVVLANRQTLIDSFIAMEKAQANLQQQQKFLAQRFPTAGT